LVGVGLLASSGLLEVLVEEVKGVDILGSELRAVDLEGSEESGGLVESGYVGRAHVGSSVSRLEASVFPALDFYHTHYIVDGHATGGGFNCQLSEVESDSAESLVKSLVEEDINSGAHHGLSQTEDEREDTIGNKRRPVVVGSIDPTEEEVVIPVGESLSGKEEFLSSSLVESSSGLWAQREMHDVLISILAVLDPVGVLGSLDTLVRPVPAALALYYI
jgi:hypothetical protein